jgi:hypothetical protein
MDLLFAWNIALQIALRLRNIHSRVRYLVRVTQDELYESIGKNEKH